MKKLYFKTLWLKAVAIVVLQGFLVSNVIPASHLYSHRTFFSNNHLRIQNTAGRGDESIETIYHNSTEISADREDGFRNYTAMVVLYVKTLMKRFRLSWALWRFSNAGYPSGFPYWMRLGAMFVIPLGIISSVNNSYSAERSTNQKLQTVAGLDINKEGLWEIRQLDLSGYSLGASMLIRLMQGEPKQEVPEISDEEAESNLSNSAKKLSAEEAKKQIDEQQSRQTAALVGGKVASSAAGYGKSLTPGIWGTTDTTFYKGRLQFGDNVTPTGQAETHYINQDESDVYMLGDWTTDKQKAFFEYAPDSANNIKVGIESDVGGGTAAEFNYISPFSKRSTFNLDGGKDANDMYDLNLSMNWLSNKGTSGSLGAGFFSAASSPLLKEGEEIPNQYRLFGRYGGYASFIGADAVFDSTGNLLDFHFGYGMGNNVAMIGLFLDSENLINDKGGKSFLRFDIIETGEGWTYNHGRWTPKLRVSLLGAYEREEFGKRKRFDSRGA